MTQRTKRAKKELGEIQSVKTVCHRQPKRALGGEEQSDKTMSLAPAADTDKSVKPGVKRSGSKHQE